MARWINNSSRKVKQMDLMRKCNWLEAKEMIELYTLTTFWRVVWMEIPLQLSQKLEIRDDLTIRMKKPRLLTCQLGFLWRAKELWNDHPTNLREISSLTLFKKLLRRRIIGKRKKPLNAESSLEESREESSSGEEI